MGETYEQAGVSISAGEEAVERIKAKVTTVNGSHASLASHAAEVAAVIEAAAQAK